jgi:hypothetical protein
MYLQNPNKKTIVSNSLKALSKSIKKFKKQKETIKLFWWLVGSNNNKKF